MRWALALHAALGIGAATAQRLAADGAERTSAACFFVTQGVVPQMPAGGRTVNLGSMVTRTAFPGIPVYSASKGFVDVLTLHLAAELDPKGITANGVAPGAIDTRMSAWMHGPGGRDTLKQIQTLAGVGQPRHNRNHVHRPLASGQRTVLPPRE